MGDIVMTEEEKKSAYEAAKARIAKHAITAATVISAISPVAAEAQNINSVETSPHTIEKTASANSEHVVVTNLEDAQNEPAFGSNEWLRAQMQTDREAHDTQTDKDVSELTHNLEEQLKSPVDMENSDNINTYCSNSHIGDFTCTLTNFHIKPDESTTEKKPRISSPRQTINHEDILRLKPGDANYVEGALAAYDVKAKKVYMQDVPLTKELEENLEKANDKAALEYMQGDNTVVKNGVLYHEMTHLNHMKYTGAADLTHPVDIAKFDRLTETTAVAVEYLNAAQQYTFMKEQGITTIEFNGEQKPLESILEPYQGLKEVVLEKGFNADDPKSVRNVVEASSKYWHESRSELYARQHKNAVNTGKKASNLFELLESDDKEYQKVAQKATKQVYIGNNKNVDLSNCMDLLDTMTTDDAQKLLADEKIINSSDVTYQKLGEVSAYLDSIGITDAKAKTSYLTENFENITTRNGDYDETLKNIMLNTNTPNKGTILYADNITEKTDETGQYSLTANSQHTAALTISNKEDVKSDMHKDRAEHDSQLQSQIETLTHPIQQEQQAGNENISPISPAMLIQGQRQGR